MVLFFSSQWERLQNEQMKDSGSTQSSGKSTCSIFSLVYLSSSVVDFENIWQILYGFLQHFIIFSLVYLSSSVVDFENIWQILYGFLQHFMFKMCIFQTVTDFLTFLIIWIHFLLALKAAGSVTINSHSLSRKYSGFSQLNDLSTSLMWLKNHFREYGIY